MSEKSSTINSVSYESAMEESQYPISEINKTSCVPDKNIPITKIDWYNKLEEKIKNKEPRTKAKLHKSKTNKKIIYSLDELYNIKTKSFLNLRNDPPLLFNTEVFGFWSFKFSIKPPSISSEDYPVDKYNNQNIPLYLENDKFRDFHNRPRNRNNVTHKVKTKHENKRHLAKDITNKVAGDPNYVFQLKKDTKRNYQNQVNYMNPYDAHRNTVDNISVIFPTSPPPKNEDSQSWANAHLQNPFLFNLKTSPTSNC